MAAMTDRARRPTGRQIRALVNKLAERDGTREHDGHYRVRCALCPGYVDTALSGNNPIGPTVEHLTPISAGGTNALDNLRLAHRSCNLSRGDRAPANLGPTSRTWL